jgi:asparagine synthase (glutamine-hydrolysing)
VRVSGIVGVLNRDGRPATTTVLERMLAAAPHRGPDGSSIVASGPVAMGHQRLTTTPEAAGESQPISDQDGRLLAFDGRIDDCDGVPAGPDASRVLRASRFWGEDCAAHLVGDFAFALWGPSTHSLFCARDPMGVRPFYYAEVGSLFLWGSDLRQVLAHSAVDAAIDEGFAAELLAGRPRSLDATLYHNVRRLPPGHALVASPSGVRVYRYWALDLAREIRCSDDQEYADRFRALFEEAVACRLRSDRPVAVYLSGGLDSSSVAVVAADLARRGRAPAVTAASMVFSGRRGTDESDYIADVVRAAGIPSIRVEAPPFDVGSCRAPAARRRDLPDPPPDCAAIRLQSELAAAGIRVTLSGLGGDHGLTGSFYHYADLLRRRRLRNVVERYSDVARSPGLGWTSAMFLRAGVWPVVPPRLKRIIRRAVRPWRQGVPPWIGRGLADRTGLADRLRDDPTPDNLESVARYDVSQLYRAGWGPLSELFERASAEAGLEDRHPFYDRRLIEFMVALPDEQRWQRGLTKYILRRALRGLLPESVRRRTDKADYSCLFADALEAMGGAVFFGNLVAARRGWVEPREVLALHRRMRARFEAGDEAYGDDAWKLWMIAGLDIWLRSLEEGIDDASGHAA